MKKILFLMTFVVSVALVMTGCKKDEDTDSESNRLKFTNQMMQNKTSFTWEGREVAKVKNEGVKKERYSVLRFDRASTESTTGTGRLVAFTNSYKTDFVESSEFRWYFNNDCLYLEWKKSGWQTAHAEYRTNEIVVDGSGFHGTWYESTSYRWEFNYIASSFNDWDKYPATD
ncbi:MAG: hypothetical protein K6E67_03050 [Prevotella sp.]|nr:hypothetical protein [Prevotella sp.]